MITHLQAKTMMTAVPGVSSVESLFCRAVSWHETNYGQGWKPGRGQGSNNMGAITTLHPDALSFKHEDSLFDPKLGKIRVYTTWFAGWPTPEAGFAGLAHKVLMSNVRGSLMMNDFYGGADGMYTNKYFMGLHTHLMVTGDRDNIKDYAKALIAAVAVIGKETGEVVPDVLPPQGVA